MFERFTAAAQWVVVEARTEADRRGHPQFGTEHLLWALAAPDAGVSARLLAEAGLEPARVAAELDRLGPDAPPLGPEDAEALRAVGIDLDAVLARIRDSFGDGATQGAGRGRRSRWGGAPRLSPRAKKVLEISLREAIRLRHKRIGSEHLLLALIREGTGRGPRLLQDLGIDLSALRRATEAELRDVA